MGEMKRFFSLMMAVILLMCAAVPAAAEEGAEIISPSAQINFRSSAQNTKNVGNNGMGGLLTDVVIIDENGKDVTKGPVEVGQKYTFKFDFKEDGENKQFVERKLTYRFPEGLTFENVARQPVKDSAGNILYPSQVAAAAGSIEGASLDPALIASVLKENGLVPVAKLAAFRDPIAARTDRNMAIGYTGQAYLWLDNKASAGGNPWLNPYSDEAVQFIGDLIGEVQSMGFDHVLLENVQFPSAQNGKQDFGSTGGRDRSAQLAADIAAWDARFEGSVTLWYGYSLGQVTEGASTVGGSATALGVRNLVVEVPAKQTMDDTARNELRDTLSASGVEHAVFWDDAAGIFQ